MRLDADVAARAGEPEATLARVPESERAVLVGTQLVAKGHDVAGVTLAAVLDAETGMSMPDFRAEERTFALLTQLAGRPGRPGDPPGRVLIQAWEPARGWSSWRPGTRSRSSWRASWSAAASSATRPSGGWCGCW